MQQAICPLSGLAQLVTARLDSAGVNWQNAKLRRRENR
jgi:hypothetical protein